MASSLPPGFELFKEYTQLHETGWSSSSNLLGRRPPLCVHFGVRACFLAPLANSAACPPPLSPGWAYFGPRTSRDGRGRRALLACEKSHTFLDMKAPSLPGALLRERLAMEVAHEVRRQLTRSSPSPWVPAWVGVSISWDLRGLEVARSTSSPDSGAVVCLGRGGIGLGR